MNNEERVSLGGRLRALMRKELGQIRRDKRLMISLVVPPTLQILLFGFALNSSVSNLRLSIVDESRTPASRDLIAAFSETGTFQLRSSPQTPSGLTAALSRNQTDVGLVIPADFEKDRIRSRPVTVQLLLNAVNANTATIAEGYTQGVLSWYNQTHPTPRPVLLAAPPRPPQITARVALLFNPGLTASWFIVTGTFGVLLVLNGSLVASAALIKEKENGTVEQLLMTPAGSGEIVLAKIAPLFLLLMGMVGLVLVLASVAFRVPVRGSLLLVIFAAALCLLAGIGIGTLIATVSKSAQQAQLMSFFVNPPLAMLSGALTPVEAMPTWIQPWTALNPIRHFGFIARSVLIKGADLPVLLPNLLALAAFAAVLLGVSMWRFRKQLS